MSVEQYKPLPITGLSPQAAVRALRLNSLGSLYYFIKVALKRRRLTDTLHHPICRSLERKHIKDVYEMPRDHFKSTICGEGLPMWRALPVTPADEDAFKAEGYSDEFIRWMHEVHDTDARNLLVSENITNAAKLGRKIRGHFESNAIFRAAFSDILPDTSCTWTDFSLHIKRPNATGSHGEGTFDFLGVGSAVQSRHYNGLLIEDDLVGRKALESPSIMDKTIDYHKLLVGVFENEDALFENDELVVGNRWAYHDLNTYIQEHEPWFVFVNHSALGGCCPLHLADTPIFPEEFSFEKLMRLKERLGNYHFSCQFLNNPCSPEDADFKPEWLSYYTLGVDANAYPLIVHEPKNGLIYKDRRISEMSLAMTVDPRHSGNDSAGRCRHALVVLGSLLSKDFVAMKGADPQDRQHYYLLDNAALQSNYDTFFAAIYKMARKWKIRRVGFESVAAQKYAIYHIEQRNRYETWPIRIVELKGEVEAPDGSISRKKEWRIRNVLAPIFESERFWCQRQHTDFVGEYQTFPKGRFCDLLDAMAYAPQIMYSPMSMESVMSMKRANWQQSRKVNQPYSVGVN
jgi:hypothetical protein